MLVGLAFAVLMSEISQPFSPLQLYVDPNGSDNNNGRSTATPLASCAGAIAAVAAELSSPQGLPPHGVDVTFAPGLYKYTTGTSCCISADCHGVNFTGTKEAPIVLHGARGDPTKVVFDGSVDVSSAELKPLPQNSTVATLINPAAVGKLYTMPMPMPPAGLEWNGVPLTPSQFPNKGLAYVRRVWDEGAVWAEGRTKGPKPTYNWTRPCGGNVSLAAPFPTGDWVAEFAAGTGFGQGAVRVSGYFSNDWYFETHDVARVAPSSAGTSIQLLDFSRYGLCEAEEDVRGDCGGQSPGRFKVYGLLSEVDMPGEYWYDTVAKVLYVYPPENSLFTIADGAPALRSTPVISMRQAGTLASVVNASYLTIRDITATGSTATLVTIEGGDHNTIGGCILKNSDGGILLAGGHNNRIIGNDIYDVNGHLSSDSDPNGGALEPTNNLITNNHLTQVFLRDTTWSVRISGVGDRFSHNLIHDAPQQVLMPKGPLTMVDHNEIFNTGYSDGDGGVIYAGASLVNGYGMHVRENFVHHSLDVPGLHGRGGIYFDDHFQAVTNASHNVLYKAAGRAFLVNGGGGSNITHNLIVNGGIGIFNQHADNITQALPLYDNGTLERGDKGDFIWRTEIQLGLDGGSYPEIFETAFAHRFPTFATRLRVNSTEEGWASPSHSNFSHNVFLNNSQGNICFLTNYQSSSGQQCDNDLPKVNGTNFLDTVGGITAAWDWFPHADLLDFTNDTLGIDTASAGLVCDEWRRSMPDKLAYRKWVKDSFEGIPAAAVGPYSPEAAEARSSLESGKELILQMTTPCPPLVRKDCNGVWLAWGECQSNNEQVMRWTIETEATDGGRPCALDEGSAQLVQC